MNLKAKLDRVFSEYIRLRDANLGNGYGECISCGKVISWKDGDCGHFINRSHMALRFSEQNTALQCRKCNRFDEGNFEGFRKGLIKKYGEGIIDKLYEAKNQINRISQTEYSIAIRHYQKEIEQLKLKL